MELVLHHERRCIRYQYSCLHAGRSIEEPSLYDQMMTGWLNLFKKSSYADSTECIEREFIAVLLEAMGFAYNKDNADLSYTHVKALPTTVQ